MQLNSYVSDLLFRYECVTIPEFGAFLTQTVSAKIDLETNTFFPPKKMLSFNERIQKNDGLLANYIADLEKIPYEIAAKKIAKRVEVLKSSLESGETLTFKNIGDISFNEEGKIIFEPSYHLNYLTDSFGLSQVVSTSVTREIYKEEVQRIEKVVPIAITPEKRKTKSYLKYAAVAVIALTIAGFSALNFRVKGIKQSNQLAEIEAYAKLEDSIQQATFTLNPLSPITINVTKREAVNNTGNYHIVAGAFRIESNCDKKIAQLKVKGFNPRKIGANKYGLHEVVYSSHETGKEALEALRVIRKTDNREAWLLMKKLD